MGSQVRLAFSLGDGGEQESGGRERHFEYSDNVQFLDLVVYEL